MEFKFFSFQKKEDLSDLKSENKFKLQINNFVYKIDNAINSFRFNVAIANFYEVYKIIREGIESKKLSKK